MTRDPYTVLLNPGNGNCTVASLTETKGGYGVTLPVATPNAAVAADWKFAGWATEPVAQTTTAPALLAAGSRYTPTADNTTLYAVYSMLEKDSAAGDEDILVETLSYDTWTYSGKTADKTSYRLFGKDAYVESQNDIDFNVLSKVVVKARTFANLNANAKSVAVKTASDKSLATIAVSSNSLEDRTSTTFTSIDEKGKLRIVSNGGDGSANGIGISEVKIYCKHVGTTYWNSNPTAGARKNPNFAFSEKEKSFKFTDNVAIADLGLTYAEGFNGEISWASADDNVLKFDGQKVVLVGEGSTTVTASFAGDDTWSMASANLSVTVIKEQVAKPVINPNGGVFAESQEVAITCETEGATIKYSIGSAEPQVYTAPFTINASCTITAVAVKEGMKDSEQTAANFIQNFDATDAIFYETFTGSTGRGGNDGNWSDPYNTANSAKYDNEGWSYSCVYGAVDCIRVGDRKNQGFAQTPALSKIEGTQNLVITFKAAPWENEAEGTLVNIECEGDEVVYPSQIEFDKSVEGWQNFTVTIAGATSATKVKFTSATGHKNRFFLDEIVIKGKKVETNLTATVFFHNPEYWQHTDCKLQDNEQKEYTYTAKAHDKGVIEYTVDLNGLTPNEENKYQIDANIVNGDKAYTATLLVEPAKEYLISGNKKGEDEVEQNVVEVVRPTEDLTVTLRSQEGTYVAAVWTAHNWYAQSETLQYIPGTETGREGRIVTYQFSIPMEHGFSRLAFVTPEETAPAEPAVISSRADEAVPAYEDAFTRYGTSTKNPPYYLEGKGITLGYQVPTAINTPMADLDANAPVEYFNLQGMRVANPAPGAIYIRRQGNTAVKVRL